VSTVTGKLKTHEKQPNFHGGTNLRAVTTVSCSTEQEKEKILEDVKHHMKRINSENEITEETRVLRNKAISPYVEVDINNVNILCLVDTGSTHTIMSQSYAKKMGLLTQNQFIQHGFINPKAANGESIKAYGHLSARIQIGRTAQAINILIADIEENAILGMDAIHQLECEINFSKMTIKTDDDI